MEIPSKLRKIPNYDIFKYILYGAFYKNLFIAEYENPHELNQSLTKQEGNINPNEDYPFQLIIMRIFKKDYINQYLLMKDYFQFKLVIYALQ